MLPDTHNVKLRTHMLNNHHIRLQVTGITSLLHLRRFSVATVCLLGDSSNLLTNIYNINIFSCSR